MGVGNTISSLDAPKNFWQPVTYLAAALLLTLTSNLPLLGVKVKPSKLQVLMETLRVAVALRPPPFLATAVSVYASWSMKVFEM